MAKIIEFDEYYCSWNFNSESAKIKHIQINHEPSVPIATCLRESFQPNPKILDKI